MQPDPFNRELEIARRHHQAGRLADAERIYRQVLAQRPNHPEALHLLGAIAHQVGQNEAAEEFMRRAVALEPMSAQFHYNLGIVLQARQKLDEAAAAYTRAAQLQPSHADSFLNLGNTLSDQEKLDEAESAYREALRLRPDFVKACANLGVVLKKQGRFADSLSLYSRAISLQPDSPDVYSNMASSLLELRRVDEAIAAATKAIQLSPNLAEAYGNLAAALRERRRLDEAYAAGAHAVKLKPDLAAAYFTMGNVLMDQGQADEAMVHFQRACELSPNDPRMESNRLYAMHFHPAYDARRIYDEHRKYNEKFARPLMPQSVRRPLPNEFNRKLRIGYVSADLRTHPIGRFLAPALQYCDRDRFENFCYSDTRTPDAMTARLAGYCTGWRDIAGWSDARVAQIVEEDAIDILVDLTMHMANCRLLVFARKPAPVQVTYLAYCSTTGLNAMDYRLTDPYLDPPESDVQCYSEKSVWLPETYWCYDAGMPTPAVSVLPALQAGYITFGCLNNFSKVTKEVLRTWRRLLETVGGSRLIVHAFPGSHRGDFMRFMTANGLDPRRLAFADKLPGPDYFALYRQIDIALDPFPCVGGTTTCDALWMGVPVVTLAGQTAVGRAGVSLLTNVGLQKWVARFQDEYVALAAQLARDLSALADLRAGLRDRMLHSPLTDAPRFARNLEAAYQNMWRQRRELDVMENS